MNTMMFRCCVWKSVKLLLLLPLSGAVAACAALEMLSRNGSLNILF